mmetsp:Transcript_29653/g.65723  ORF Transcript_29653/g.65723 Transcript_29653/m.65723 type:complete len:368 (-) Transcript_29653:511-1614(-)
MTSATSMVFFRATFSSSERSPRPLAILRSICCIWNSALYSNSCCLAASLSSWVNWASRLRVMEREPDISECSRVSSIFSWCTNWCSLRDFSLSALHLANSLLDNFSRLARSSSACFALASAFTVFDRAMSIFPLITWYRCRSLSNCTFFSSKSCAVCAFRERMLTNFSAEVVSSFLSDSNSPLNSICLAEPTIISSLLRRTIRLSVSDRISTSLFSPFCVTCLFCCNANCDSFFVRSTLATAKRSPISFISLSLFFISAMVSCHLVTNACLSRWAFLNSTAMRSSSICFAKVSVASSFNLEECTIRSLVRCSSCRESSLILISSERLYRSIAVLSSSFCLLATTHCSNSSWFQFICILNSSIFSLAL